MQCWPFTFSSHCPLVLRSEIKQELLFLSRLTAMVTIWPEITDNCAVISATSFDKSCLAHRQYNLGFLHTVELMTLHVNPVGCFDGPKSKSVYRQSFCFPKMQRF